MDASVQTSSEHHIDVVINQGGMMPGSSRVSIEILILPAGKTLGIYFDL